MRCFRVCAELAKSTRSLCLLSFALSWPSSVDSASREYNPNAPQDPEATRIWQMIRGEDCQGDGYILIEPTYCIEPTCDFQNKKEFCSIKSDEPFGSCRHFPEKCKELAERDQLSNCCGLAQAGDCTKDWVKVKCSLTCGTHGATESSASGMQPNPDLSRCPQNKKNDFINSYFGNKPPEDLF